MLRMLILFVPGAESRRSFVVRCGADRRFDEAHEHALAAPPLLFYSSSWSEHLPQAGAPSNIALRKGEQRIVLSCSRGACNPDSAIARTRDMRPCRAGIVRH